MWFDILKKEVAKKGPAQVAKELGVSRALIDMVIQSKYSASMKNIKRRVENMYGSGGHIHCPVLGEISPNICAEKWTLAKRIGLKAGNPETLRLYKTCLKCGLRKV